MIFPDSIAVYICGLSFLNFFRCISQSKRVKQTSKFSLLDKLEIES